MPVRFLPSQLGIEQDTPLPYTASPLKLLWGDILLFFRSLWSLPGVILPLRPWNSGVLDELYPSTENLCDIIIHCFLVVYQLVFLLSLPIFVAFAVPALFISIYVGFVLLVNYGICRFGLNGKERILVSRVPVADNPEHKREHWIFVNGVAAGHHWMQSNIDRLAYTFGRKITGVHNPTAGIVFDLIECLIQRDLSYATQDVRDAFAITKRALLDPQYEKIILILHSQGGIEGGLIIDWLLDVIPQELLQNLEVYTFGNAANHFNDPCKTFSNFGQYTSEGIEREREIIPHIEHYANSQDFVSVWGVLNFVSIPNRYMGRVFVRPGSGHYFNQHYLATMFTLGSDMKALDTNDFMEMEVEIASSGAVKPSNAGGEIHGVHLHDVENALTHGEMDASQSLAVRNASQRVKVKDLSRLWLYRNGASPMDATS